MIRKAICAGTWYPREKKEIAMFMDLNAKKEKVIAAVCPHAGWVYSGKVAGAVYSKINLSGVRQPLFILIGPNHTSFGTSTSIMTEGEWQMPLGKIKIAQDIARKILENSQTLEEDIEAHLQEHSIEVQLPFIQYLFAEEAEQLQIVPICLADYRLTTCKDIGESIAQSVQQTDQQANTVIIASTDMTHYESQKNAERKDKLAIQKILDMDPEGLLETVKRENISMCGSGPTAAVLYAAKRLGARDAQLVLYQTSGDVTDDYSAVVGYAGLVIK